MADPGAVNGAGVVMSLDRGRHRLRERRALPALCQTLHDPVSPRSMLHAPRSTLPREAGQARDTMQTLRGERSCSDKKCSMPDAATESKLETAATTSSSSPPTATPYSLASPPRRRCGVYRDILRLGHDNIQNLRLHKERHISHPALPAKWYLYIAAPAR